MKNKKLRETFREKRCLVCSRLGCDACHIKTYATTLEDDERNLMPLCRIHHSEQHQIGIVTFIKKYPRVRLFVEYRGFEIDHRNKLTKKA